MNFALDTDPTGTTPPAPGSLARRGPGLPFATGLLTLLALGVLALAARSVAAEEPATTGTVATAGNVDFNRDIRPILSQNCFFCHGPDADERKGGPKRLGGLRLDTQAGQRQDLGGRAAVVPGDSKTSELLKRLLTDDVDEVMPPRESGKRLSAGQIELVRRWIADGARFSNHWSYERPVRPPPPLVSRPGWARNSIDRFVLARLERESLSPQPEAGRATLARRVALDLTGLPPTPTELERLLQDPAPDAYERYVDRLLAQTAYGEHWARMWLDLARYADSAGYADDPPRTIWPYRDYVINAFNENLPFDRFTLEQLAGDLLPEPTEEQLKATAFHRNTMTNSEGGTSDEEFRNVAVVDRVNTTFAVWMGTSMACAQCHTHKYDPISQKEYFQVFAFLNSTADADRPDEAPLLEFDSVETREARSRLSRELATMETRFQSATPDLTQAADDWARIFPARLSWQAPRPSSFRSESGARFELLEDQSLLVTTPGTNLLSDTYTVELPIDQETTLTGLRLEALTHDALEGRGPGLAGNFRVRQVRARILPVPNQAGPLTRFLRIELPRRGTLQLAEVQVFSSGENVAPSGSATQSSVAGPAAAGRAIDGRTNGVPAGESLALTREEESPWWEVDLGATRPVERVVVWNGAQATARLEGFRVVALDEQRHPVWEKSGNGAPKAEVAFDLNGPREVDFVNASSDFNEETLDEALVATDSPRSVRYRKRGEKGWAVGGATGSDHELLLATANPVTVPRGATLSVTVAHQAGAAKQLLGRFRLTVTGDGHSAEHVDTPPAVRAALATEPARRETAQRDRIVDHFVRHVAPGLRHVRERFAALERERDSLKPLTVPVVREVSAKDRRTTRVQLRGNFLTTGDEVTEGVPAAWHALPAGAPMNRLTLARWLVSEENPLTSRVIANRFWEQIFGHGIVRTSEEFGSQGDPPVNQELLDWLATELVALQWDLKRFLKLLVTTAAYRQDSRVTPEALEKDPDNRLVSRGPRFRLGAETVRDQALAVAGLLSPRLGGASVRPPRPNLDLRAAFGGNLDWQTSPGEDRYRRGLYTEWRRTSPYPSMATFDAPSREVCTLRRNRSNTPLQALVTLNDPVFVEAAQALARRMIRAGASPVERLEEGYRRVLSRSPSAAEQSEFAGLVAEMRATLIQDPARARALAGAPGGGEETVEIAAWTTVANVLLNLDETLMKR